MNIYEKVQAVKSDLNMMCLKKSGKNQYSNYTYYELSDFLPAIVEKCKEYKLMTFVTFTADTAILTAVNSEKPEEIVEVTSPMKEIQMKGCNEVQALGGVETYQRRYLYMALFDIVENDMFDAGNGKDEKRPVNETDKQKQEPRSNPQKNIKSSNIQPHTKKLMSTMKSLVTSGKMTENEVLEKMKILSQEKKYTEFNEEECKIAIDFLTSFAAGDNNE